MFPVLIAALALAGAPQIPTHCDPSIQPLGTTYYNAERQSTYTVLGKTACAALTIAAASPRERIQIERLNPTLNWNYVVGTGLLTVLVEIAHTTHAYEPDETNDECRALKILPQLLSSYLQGQDLLEAEADVVFLENQLPAEIYHTHPC